MRAKLLYGLESAQLIPSVLRRIEVFQLKVLRKILKIDTTFIDRAKTNKVVFELANQQLEAEGKHKQVVTFIEAYQALKRKRAINIIQNEGNPIYKVTFVGDRLWKWVHPNRRVGRPRANWAEETIREIWDHIKKDDDRYKYAAFDNDKEEHIEYIKEKTAN